MWPHACSHAVTSRTLSHTVHLQVAEVAFINQMLDEDRKLSLQQKLEEGGRAGGGPSSTTEKGREGGRPGAHA